MCTADANRNSKLFSGRSSSPLYPKAPAQRNTTQLVDTARQFRIPGIVLNQGTQIDPTKQR